MTLQVISKNSWTSRLKPCSDKAKLAETKREFQTLILRAKAEPTIYLVNCLGELIPNVLTERENTKDSQR
jgi:adenosyl cobinamide kinase/adenosyl cobinamide phosphate guanylyltransferase